MTTALQTTGQTTEQLGVTTTNRTGELAMSAMAAKAKATVEARYAIAFHPNNRRNFDIFRQSILNACKRPHFAEAARYKKPMGRKKVGNEWVDNFIEGFSIRFAEEAIKAMKNISVESTTVYEDEDKRTVNVSVTDLESNLTYGREISISKTVERSKPKEGQEIISRRLNSVGEQTFLVRATEDEIANKIASAESKIIRNCGLRLIPSDILEEAEEAIENTLASGGSDPRAGIKKLTDAFAGLNVNAAELIKYLGHPLDTVSAKEMADLRAIYATIKDNEASWSDYVGEQPDKKKPEITKPAKSSKPVMESKAEPVAEESPAGSVPDTSDLPVDENAADRKAAEVAPFPFAQSLHDQMTSAGVTVEAFVKWALPLGRVTEEDGCKKWASFMDISEAVAERLLADAKGIRNVIMLKGKK